MNKAVYARVNEAHLPNPKRSRAFNADVFKVHDPPCPGCREDMGFYVFENFQGTGQDWIQWSCQHCGFSKNVEIL